MERKIRKLHSAILILVLLLGLATSAYAVSAPPEAGPYELVLESKYGGAALAGIPYDLYYVASRPGYTDFTLAAPFNSYPPITADLNHMTAAEWNAFASTMQGYVYAFDPAKTASGVSDSAGLCSFDNLHAGLYLVVGHSTAIDGYTYVPKVAVIAVPGYDEGTDSWISPMQVQIKISRNAGGDYTLTRKVIKVWNDGGAADRPGSVTVSLLENGAVYDTVVLSSANNWRYTWEGLNCASVWTLTEQPVAGYSRVITQEGITFRVENTKTTPPPPPAPPTPTPKPTPTPDDEEEDFRLPQTGVLWWPVPVLALAGIACITIGVVLNRKANDEE